MEAHYQYCLDQIKPTDAYAAILYLPDEVRKHAIAIYAFANEIEKIPNLVKEPMAGEVRMQWWREVIEGEREGEALANPVSQALNQTIKAHELSRDGFVRLIEAKLFDLYNDPMPDVETLEAYLGESESFILQMIAICSGAPGDSNLADACGHGGVAIGIAKLLKLVPQHTSFQKSYIPATLLPKHDLVTAHWLAADASDKHRDVFKEFASLGLDHYHKSVAAIGTLQKEQRSVFLSLSNAKKICVKAQKVKGDPRQSALAISPLASQLSLFKAAMFGLSRQ